MIDVVRELEDYEIQVDVYDPWADTDQAHDEFGLNLINKPLNSNYDGIVLAVAHEEFKSIGIKAIRSFGKDNHVLYDLKNVFDIQDTDLRL